METVMFFQSNDHGQYDQANPANHRKSNTGRPAFPIVCAERESERAIERHI